MSGQQKYREDTKDWPLENELAFIQILFEKMKQLGNISFKRAMWIEMDDKLFAAVGDRYGVDKLRGKFNRLRKKYREFSELIAHNHVMWDCALNKVLAPEEVWQKFCLRGKSFKAFRKKGCDHYELLGQIFGKSTASALVQHSSSSHRQLEEEFLATKIGDSERYSPSEGGDSGSFKDPRGKRACEYVLEEQCKKRNTTESTVEASVSTKSNVPKTKSGIGKGMSERARTRMPEKIDPCSIELCMEVLNSLEDISTASYNACLEKFTDRNWRKMFMMMPVERKKGWLEGLT